MPAGRVTPSRTAGEHLRVVAAEVAQLAAEFVRTAFGNGSLRGTKSSDTDIVTHTDVASERLIRRELRSRCPGSTVVGEELEDDDGANAISWIVDPIDGTVNFLYDLPVVSVSIAARIGPDVVAGAVADVLRAEVFSASRGGGARRNGEPIGVRNGTELSQALIGTGFSYRAERRAEQSAILDRILPATRDIRCMGSAALNLCWVGCGRLDGYYEHDTKLYDYAAGALIAAEGGATVELPASNQRGLSIAASPRLFADLYAGVTG